MKNMLRLILAIALSGYMFTIFNFSSIPGSKITIQTPDYILHAIAFGGLSFLFSLYFLLFMDLKPGIFFSLFFTFVYALGDEAHQSFVPGRYSDWRDIASDMVGAMLAQLILIILIRYFSVLKLKE